VPAVSNPIASEVIALTRLLPESEPPVLGIWGVYLSRRQAPSTLRNLLEFLVQRFTRTPGADFTSTQQLSVNRLSKLLILDVFRSYD